MAPAQLHWHERQIDRARVATTANPLLLLARLTLESAFVDASQVDETGKPTAEALDAVAWITADLDWVRRRIAPPPPELRGEFLFSFSHICQLLRLDPDEVRRNGLQRVSGLTHKFHGTFLPGVVTIRERWQQARQQNARAQV